MEKITDEERLEHIFKFLNSDNGIIIRVDPDNISKKDIKKLKKALKKRKHK